MKSDRQIIDIYCHVFEVGPEFCYPPQLGSYFSVSKSTVQVPCLNSCIFCNDLVHLCQIGHYVLSLSKHSDFGESVQRLVPLRCQLATLEALALCVKMNWMAVVVCVISLYETGAYAL